MVDFIVYLLLQDSYNELPPDGDNTDDYEGSITKRVAHGNGGAAGGTSHSIGVPVTATQEEAEHQPISLIGAALIPVREHLCVSCDINFGPVYY